MFLVESTQDGLLEMIANLKNEISSGEDGISNIVNFIINPLTHFMNVSLKKNEIVMKVRFVSFLESNNIITQHQRQLFFPF